VLAKLVFASGLFLHCAGPSNDRLWEMARTMIEVCWILRLHTEVSVRRAVLLSAYHAVHQLSYTSLSELLNTFPGFTGYLEASSSDDPDDEARQLAVFVLRMIYEKNAAKS